MLLNSLFENDPVKAGRFSMFAPGGAFVVWVLPVRLSFGHQTDTISLNDAELLSIPVLDFMTKVHNSPSELQKLFSRSKGDVVICSVGLLNFRNLQASDHVCSNQVFVRFCR